MIYGLVKESSRNCKVGLYYSSAPINQLFKLKIAFKNYLPEKLLKITEMWSFIETVFFTNFFHKIVQRNVKLTREILNLDSKIKHKKKKRHRKAAHTAGKLVSSPVVVTFNCLLKASVDGASLMFLGKSFTNIIIAQIRLGCIFFLICWIEWFSCLSWIFYFSRAAKAIHCAQNVKTVRLCTEFNKSINNIFLICHILWHFQDGRHWPWEFHIGQKLETCSDFSENSVKLFVLS